jgi:hypothetical protein
VSISRAVSNKRLLKLADFLEKLKPARFDYGEWVGKTWQGGLDLSCGTTACALGWAAAMPEFRRLGLRLIAYDPEHPEGGGTVRDIETGAEDQDAAVRVFGLDSLGACELFLPGPGGDFPKADATPKQVAKHIRRFVKDRQ